MKTYGFSIILKDIPCLEDEIAERLFEAGCDDCSSSSGEGITRAAFDREEESLEKAIATAIRDVRKAGYEVDRVVMDDYDLNALLPAEVSGG